MITAGLRSLTARNTANSIAYYRVNLGNTFYDKFAVKQPSGVFVNIEMNIPEEIKKVTRIDIYDANKSVLATITSTFDTIEDTRVKYRIEVKSQ